MGIKLTNIFILYSLLAIILSLEIFKNIYLFKEVFTSIFFLICFSKSVFKRVKK